MSGVSVNPNVVDLISDDEEERSEAAGKSSDNWSSEPTNNNPLKLIKFVKSAIGRRRIVEFDKMLKALPDINDITAPDSDYDNENLELKFLLKAVMGEHESLIKLINSLQARLETGKGEKLIQKFAQSKAIQLIRYAFQLQQI